MAQTIISKCSRIWSQELRIGVLHRSLEPRLSVWDCVPEHIIDAHVKDAFEYLPEQRDYILHYAICGSAIVRSVRRLDGYRSSPLELSSLRFNSEGEVDAYHFPQESDITLDFSESEYGEDDTASRASTPLPTSIPEFEDNEIHTATQDDDSELEDEADRGKPQQWTHYLESEDTEICSSPQQSASDVDDEAFSPEPRELFTIYECDEELESTAVYLESEDTEICSSPQQSASDVDDEAFSPEPRELFTIFECDEELEDSQDNDEPAEANSPEPQQISPIHKSHLEFSNDQQKDQPLEAESPEFQRPFPLRHESPVPEYDYDERDEGSVDTESPEPRRLFPVHQLHAPEYDPDPRQSQPAPQMETYCPAPLRRFLTPDERLKFDAFEDWFVRMSKRTATSANSEKCISATPSPEPRRLFPLRYESPVSKYNDEEKDDDSLRSDSPEPRRLFPVHQFHSTEYDPPQAAPQTETYCPAPLRRFLEPEEQLKFDAFEDWFVRMHRSKRTNIGASLEEFLSEKSSFPFRHKTPVPDYDNDEKDDEPESPEPRRLFPVRQFHSTEYDPPQAAPQMETYCPAPLRRFLEPEEQLKFDAFEDWFVRMHRSKRTDIDASLEEFLSEKSSFPFRHKTPVPDYDNDEKDDEPESPEPRRLFPVHQFHSTEYGPPQAAPQLETFCPGPLRRFLTPEERLKFDAFEDWFVRMHRSKHTDIDASLEECLSETSNPEPRRFFPVHQPHSWLKEPIPLLECNNEEFETMEFIPVESLGV
ncbi:hypothetical protein MMC31_007076 [Peltigera leucophlebia]|nr:hypothetical protein [Peltigera leucophlebia]